MEFGSLRRQILEWAEESEEIVKGLPSYADQAMPSLRLKGESLRKAVGVATIQRIYDAERKGRLPPPELDARGNRLGYDLNQVVHAINVFGTGPGRSSNDPAVVLAVTNYKGGCTKTTTAWTQSVYYASLGYRVLAIDLDAQGTFTRHLGYVPDVDIRFDQTLAYFILRHEEPTVENIKKIIRPVDRLQNLHLIPASLDYHAVESNLASATFKAGTEQNRELQRGLFLSIRHTLSQIRNDYDIIILDGTPSAGIIPLNMVFAADEVIVPIPMEAADFCSTSRFFSILSDQFESLIESEVIRENEEIGNFWALGTKFQPSQTKASKQIKERYMDTVFKDRVFKNSIHRHDSIISNLSHFCRTPFEVPEGTLNIDKKAYQRAILNFTNVFDEVLEKCVFPHWPARNAKARLLEEVAANG